MRSACSVADLQSRSLDEIEIGTSLVSAWSWP